MASQSVRITHGHTDLTNEEQGRDYRALDVSILLLLLLIENVELIEWPESYSEKDQMFEIRNNFVFV